MIKKIAALLNNEHETFLINEDGRYWSDKQDKFRNNEQYTFWIDEHDTLSLVYLLIMCMEHFRLMGKRHLGVKNMGHFLIMCI